MPKSISRREFLKTVVGNSVGLATAFGAPYYSIGSESPTERARKFGNFNDSKPAKAGLEGVVIGVPFGDAFVVSRKLAVKLGDYLGTGLVVADGFKKVHGFNVTNPTRGDAALYKDLKHDKDSTLVHQAYKSALDKMAKAAVEFYFEVRASPNLDRPEIQTSGVSSDEARLMKKIYETAIARLPAAEAAKVAPDIRVEPLDLLRTDSWGTKHHGAPLYYPRSFIVVAPRVEGTEEAYAKALASLIAEALPRLRQGSDINGQRMRQIRTEILDLGRFEYIEATSSELKGVVVGAPHGSDDFPTAEVVTALSMRLGIGAVIAKGFTKYETGDHRINVNRPTEGAVLRASEELPTPRARRIYQQFERLVNRVAGEQLGVYVDVHSNDYHGTRDRVEVASNGISAQEARSVKEALAKAFDKNSLALGLSNLKIQVEPEDRIFWAATLVKRDGVLGNASKGLHVEVPSTLKQVRVLYTDSLFEAVPEIANVLRAPRR